MGAVSHKVCNMIFAIRRDNKPFEIITPQEHIKQGSFRLKIDYCRSTLENMEHQSSMPPYSFSKSPTCPQNQGSWLIKRTLMSHIDPYKVLHNFNILGWNFFIHSPFLCYLAAFSMLSFSPSRGFRRLLGDNCLLFTLLRDSSLCGGGTPVSH